MKYLLSIAAVLLVMSILMGMSTVRPDRISFYNEPADSNKFESHINYADGGPEVHKSYGVCEAGRVISETLNLYRVSWTAEACTAETHQQLNLRWVEGCRWDFEHDPWARIDTYGSYGHSTIVGHYDQGEVDLPIPTDTLSMTVVMSHTEGSELWAGNALFVFNEGIGCTSPPNTQTPTETPTETSTPEPLETVIDDNAITPTATPEPSGTPTTTATIIVVCCPDVPETVTPTGVPPTGLTPTGEPGVRKVYLPVVDR